MKSSSKSLRCDASMALPAWQPVDLVTVTPAAPQDVQREQFLALFGRQNGSEAKQREKEMQSPLFPVEIGKKFATWVPDEFNWAPPFMASNEWMFIDEPTVTSKPFEDTHRISLDKAEKEAIEILRKARTQTEEMILEAERSADETLLQAQAEVEALKKEAYEQGWTEARREAETVLSAAQSVLQEVRAWQNALLAQSEKTMIEMVKEISNVMFGEGAALDSQTLRTNFDRILDNARTLGDLKIFLNPGDASVLDPSWREAQELITGNKVQIIPSENIKRGGCFVQGHMGTVDARVEVQLQTLLAAFEEPEEVNLSVV